MGDYSVILADPPWHYKVWNRDTGSGRSAESHYQTMTLDDICSLPVQELATPDCALFLWAVWPSIFDAREVIEAWGFDYRTIAWAWVKQNKSGFGLFTGMGYYTRANTEPCLLAVRGRMPVQAHDVLSVIMAPIRQHSQKPDGQYDKIDRLYPEGKRIELFARQAWPGWDTWGNQAPNSIDWRTDAKT